MKYSYQSLLATFHYYGSAITLEEYNEWLQDVSNSLQGGELTNIIEETNKIRQQHDIAIKSGSWLQQV